MLLELLAVGLLLCSGDSREKSITKSRPAKKNDYCFEEADSFLDRHGNEHIVDYEGYCEECDDYHDF